MVKPAIYAYVDETGNTGCNIFDENQPDFFTAALITKGDIDLTCGARVADIAKILGRNSVHAKEIGEKGLETIAPKILELFEQIKAHFFVSRVEKKYLLATKVFDSIFDAGENAAVAWQHYNLRPLRIILAFKVAATIDDEIARLFWECLLEPDEKKAQTLLPVVCEKLKRNVGRLPDEKSRVIITDGLDWAIKYPEAIQIHNDRKLARQGHLPNMVAFVNLLAGLQHYSELWKRPVARITHDEQHEFATSLTNYHEMYSGASPEPLKWVGEEYVFQKVPGSDFVMKEDEVSPGIQLTDVILWLFSQHEKGRQLRPRALGLLNYIFEHAWINDFSFRGVEESIIEKYPLLFSGELTDEQQNNAQKAIDALEKRRLESMERYKSDKIPPFARPDEPAADLHREAIARLK